MFSTDAEINHVSDTALLVAACRALEMTRPDCLVRDPFAAELAGERGTAMLQDTPRREMLCFGIGIRSFFLDELVMDAVTSRGVSTVLSLGAGLDTRPWRLDLPEHVRWIEADFPGMLDYKHSIMASHQPKCRLDRMPADLTDVAARSAVFAAAASAPALMITEGLLAYLPGETVEALASGPARGGAIQYWLLDLASPEMTKRVQMDAYQSIQRVRAESHVNGTQILEILTRNGWNSVCHRDYTVDAWKAAQARIMTLAQSLTAVEQPPPLPAGDPSGIHLFART